MNKKILQIASLVVLVAAAGVLIYRDMKKNQNGEPKTVNGVEMTGDGKVVVQSMNANLPPAPPLERSFVPLKTLLPQIVTAVQNQMATTIATLKKDPKRVDAWIDLGLQRKTLGDYEGARLAWEYAKALAQNTNIVPWNNLGDLYHFYLKDYVKSEENWKKVIALKPDYIQGYRGLFELYTYSYKEKASQIPVFLKAGIAKNPTSTDLKQMLADYEKTLVK